MKELREGQTIKLKLKWALNVKHNKAIACNWQRMVSRDLMQASGSFFEFSLLLLFEELSHHVCSHGDRRLARMLLKQQTSSRSERMGAVWFRSTLFSLGMCKFDFRTAYTGVTPNVRASFVQQHHSTKPRRQRQREWQINMTIRDYMMMNKQLLR